MSKELKLELYQFIIPSCELGFNAFTSKLQKSFAWGVCVEYLALLTKPRGLVWLDPKLWRLQHASVRYFGSNYFHFVISFVITVSTTNMLL